MISRAAHAHRHRQGGHMLNIEKGSERGSERFTVDVVISSDPFIRAAFDARSDMRYDEGADCRDTAILDET